MVIINRVNYFTLTYPKAIIKNVKKDVRNILEHKGYRYMCDDPEPCRVISSPEDEREIVECISYYNKVNGTERRIYEIVTTFYFNEGDYDTVFVEVLSLDGDKVIECKYKGL